MPSSRSSSLAMAPAATRAADSRAEARSSTYRASEKLYFTAPARSACPGRGEATRLCLAGSPSSTGSASVQFCQSFFANHHPYTEGLLLSLPAYGGERERLRPIHGQPPSLISLPDRKSTRLNSSHL